jgi:hypothetical protein
MKQCSKNRKLIAWLALGALEARKAASLRDHLAGCEGCRRYWEEISNVTEGLAAASAFNLEASEFFHHRVAEKLKAVESSSVLENVAAWFRGSMLNWRVVLPATAVLVIALFAIITPRPNPAVSPSVQVVSKSSTGSDMDPTLANYQIIANQSLEKLSELLIRQGSKPLPPVPVYTASSFEPADASF